ncbi:MAG: NYN domain-containing protein, partial [Candidatus Aenigmatarchaeota archaeon]
MADKLRIYAYFDGSNFYHYCLQSYGIKRINFFDFTNHVSKIDSEKVIKIKYFNCPLNQQEYPSIYKKQQKFFEDLKKTTLVELLLGNLVKRPLGKINIDCPSCSHQRSESLNCPKCKRRINVKRCFKYIEKGVDVKLATQMLVDAMDDKYDIALLFSSDSDYCPAIR